MLAVIAILTALTVVLFALTLAQLRPNRSSVTARLDQIHPDGRHEVQARRRRTGDDRLSSRSSVVTVIST